MVEGLLRALLVAFMLGAMAGCALVTRGTQQSIRIDAVSSGGTAMAAPSCSSGEVPPSKPQSLPQVQPGAAAGQASGSGLLVKRSFDDLLIRCTGDDGRVVASARMVSRADMALVSLIVGGMISATVDQISGAAYAYPDWIRLVAGEERIYDRRDSAGGPVAGIFSKSLLGQPALASAGAANGAGPASKLDAWYRAKLDVPPSHLLRPGARPTGRDTYNAEKLAVSMNCSATPRAVLVERGGGFELHRVGCAGGSTLMVRCEFGNCRAQAEVAIASGSSSDGDGRGHGEPIRNVDASATTMVGPPAPSAVAAGTLTAVLRMPPPRPFPQ